MEQQQWSEWIEWKGGECPIPHAKAGEWQFSADGISPEEAASFASMVRPDFYRFNWLRTGARHWPITSYRVRLTTQQPTEPATTESDRDIDIGDGVDENAAMLARDSAGMVIKAVEPVPEFELQIEAEEAPGLLVVAPMERLGATRWGAE